MHWREYIRFYLYLVAGLLIKGNIFCQDITFTRFNKNEGLPSSVVYCSYKDKRGFSWIGTSNGLVKYDGARVQALTGQATNPLAGVPVYQVLEGEQGNFWVSTAEGVGIFDPVSYSFRKIDNAFAYLKPADHQLRVLWKDSKGNLFLDGQGYGIRIYDRETNSFSENNLPFTIPVNWRINYVSEDEQTGDYLVTADSGIAIFRWNGKQLVYKQNDPGGLALFKLVTSRQYFQHFTRRKDQYWITLWDKGWKVACYDIPSNRFIPVRNNNKNAPANATIADIFHQTNGRTWVYGPGQLLNYQDVKGKFYNANNITSYNQGMLYSVINSLAEDDEQNLWISTDKGLYVLSAAAQATSFFNFPQQGGMEISAFLQTKSNEILIGTRGNGILVLDSNNYPVKSDFYRIPERPDPDIDRVWDLLQHSRTRQVWAACQAGKLIVFNPSTGGKRYTRPPAFNRETIRHIAEDTHNNLWFGTYNGNLVKWNYRTVIDTGDFKAVQHFGSAITSLLADPSGQLWVGTESDGLYTIDLITNEITWHYQKNASFTHSLNSNTVTGIVQYNASTLFVTGDALNIIHNSDHTVKIIGPKNGLPFNEIKAACADNDHNLWITTADEIYKFNYARNLFTVYGQSEGFVNAAGINSRAYCTTSDTLLFGGATGLLLFNPKSVDTKLKPPNVTIGGFRLPGGFLSIDSLMQLKQVTLDHDQNSFSVYFSSTSYSQRNRLNFYYKLEGADKDWVKTDVLFSHYSLLPPGHYNFKVKTINGEGLEAVQPASLQIYIRYPFWRTWWFILSAALLVFVFVYLVHRLRMNKLLAIHKLKVKAARDLQDETRATLTTIGILGEMAKAKTDNPEVYGLIERMGDNSNQMTEMMDDIAWSTNPDNNNMRKVMAHMREYAEALLKPKNIDYTFQVQEAVNDTRLNLTSRRDLFLIFKETLKNMAKYSQCAAVNIDINRQGKKLVMLIQDDGLGFDMDNDKKGNAVFNIRKRAKMLNATVDILSNADDGTTVLLQLPVA